MNFSARWSTSLIIVSLLMTGICLVAAFAVARVLPWLGALVLALPAIAALYCIRGYALDRGCLRVKRLLWNTDIPLHGLHAADADPTLLSGSLRTFGNGGFFSFSGWYYNKQLGKYRSFVTNLGDAVVLRFDDRTIVVSPHPPQGFANRVLAAGTR